MNNTKVVVVYGRPGCGKTTYVQNHIGENDIAFDYDKLFAAISFRKEHETARNCQFEMLMNFRRTFLLNMQRSGADTAFLIVVDPEKVKQYIPRNAEYVDVERLRNGDQGQ